MTESNVEHRQMTHHQIIIDISEEVLLKINRGDHLDITLHSNYSNKDISIGLTQGQIDKLTVKTNSVFGGLQ